MGTQIPLCDHVCVTGRWIFNITCLYTVDGEVTSVGQNAVTPWVSNPRETRSICSTVAFCEKSIPKPPVTKTNNKVHWLLHFTGYMGYSSTSLGPSTPLSHLFHSSPVPLSLLLLTVLCYVCVLPCVSQKPKRSQIISNLTFNMNKHLSENSPFICKSIKPGEIRAPSQSISTSAKFLSSKNTFSGLIILPSRTHRSSWTSLCPRSNVQLKNLTSDSEFLIFMVDK